MKETGYLINGTKECFVYLFDLLQDEPRSNSFRRSRDSKDSTDSYTRKSFYIYISDLLEYLLCSDVRLNRLIYYDKRHVLFCLDFIFDFMLATNNKQLRNNISQQNILSTICTESLVNKT